MAKSWKDLTLDEAVERAKGISRQALHIAIKTYTASGRTDVVKQLRQVRKTLKRDRRIDKVGRDVVEAVEADIASRKARAIEFSKVATLPVVGYEGKWSATRDGRIWSHSRCKWLSPSTLKSSNKGYQYVSSGVTIKYVHRLIAATFVPNPGSHRNVRHKDGNAKNNAADNLEWFGKVQKLDK